MTGSDGVEEAFASLVDFAAFKLKMANEVAQLQTALESSMNDITEASHRPTLGGGRWRQQG